MVPRAVKKKSLVYWYYWPFGNYLILMQKLLPSLLNLTADTFVLFRISLKVHGQFSTIRCSMIQSAFMA